MKCKRVVYNLRVVDNGDGTYSLAHAQRLVTELDEATTEWTRVTLRKIRALLKKQERGVHR